MKLKLFAVFSLALVVGANAASISIGNITLGGTDVLLFDNSGNPLTGGTVSLFAGASPTTLEAARALTNPVASFALDATSAPGGGLFSSAFVFANPDGGPVRNADLFVLFSDVSGTQFGAYDIPTVVNAGDTPTPFGGDVNLTDSGLVTLGSVSPIAAADYSAVAGPGAAAPAVALSLAAIPEPSAILLGGIALLGGLVRRRR